MDHINLQKEINLQLLRKIIKSERKLTKPQLASLSGLSVVTVNSLIKVLLDKKEVFTDEIIYSGGGRPALAYRFNAEHRLALVIYMHEEEGNDTLFASVDNLYGESLAQIKKIANHITLSDFDVIIEEFLSQYSEIKVIAFGMPGVEINGKLNLIDYENLRGEAFSEHFINKFNLPVIFENDLNAATIGYCVSNAVGNDECIVAVYYPSKYPPGAGVFLNGKIHKGKNGTAGEVKYLPLDVIWEQCTEEERKKAVGKVILSITSLYNPNQVILYGEFISQAIAEELFLFCKRQMPEEMLPEIIALNDFDHDFAIGIQNLALEFLEFKIIDIINEKEG